MNKYQKLIKKIVATAIKCGVAIVIAGGIYGAVVSYEGGVLKKKSEVDAKLSQDEAALGNLRGQIEQTGAAEKKFIELQGARTVEDFSANFEAFQAFLKSSQGRHRLLIEPFKKINEVPTDKAELKNFSYDVLVRPKFEFTVKAISDVHIFSFIRDMQRNAPGLVHIEKVTLKRIDKADLTDNGINALKTGDSSLIVEAKIQLTLIRFVEKTNKSTAAAPTNAP